MLLVRLCRMTRCLVLNSYNLMKKRRNMSWYRTGFAVFSYGAVKNIAYKKEGPRVHKKPQGPLFVLELTCDEKYN